MSTATKSSQLCECGCGHPTNIAKNSDRRHGHVAGQPMRFIRGHAFRKYGHRGPMPDRLPVVIGTRYGRWVIIEEADSVTHRSDSHMYTVRFVRARCDCGTERILTFKDLRTGHSKSCSCYKTELVSGDRSPNWKGGLTPLRQQLYNSREWRQALRIVLRRDKHCRLCFSPDNYEIHHIEPFSSAPFFACEVWNLIRLCTPCHKKVTGREKWWRRRLYALTGWPLGQLNDDLLHRITISASI